MSSLYQLIEQIGREKGVDAQVIISAVEDAILTAAKKYYRTEEDYKARLNRETGHVDVFLVKRVVSEVGDPSEEISLDDARRLDPKAELGGEVELHKPTAALGRIAAQTAKQVIFQKVREAERDHIFSEYGDRVGQLVTGIVKRAETGDLVVDLGKTEALLPRREQSRAEVFNPGERIRVVIVRVSRTHRGPQVIVSRTDPSLLARLFEMEVPEIYEGTVIVKSAVREPGDRAKVAVFSKDKDVDPVGACVGIKGARVQNIIRELRGEKIDIVEWDDDPRTFALNALNPAKVSRVAIVDEKEKIMEVIVEDKQLSLAIGKRGQNVRLAARLLGWKIDIKSEEEKKREVQSQMDAAMASAETDIRVLEGIGEKTLKKLVAHGITSLEKLLAAPETARNVPGVGDKTAEKLVVAARAYVDEVRSGAEVARVSEERESAAAVPEVAENGLEDVSGGEL
ncbi:MAG TPA: transcription termination factor NusA [Vicinamibacteria bacterium]|nr:transcription termination factor NusA [Vicinamibacteria bacterium]